MKRTLVLAVALVLVAVQLGAQEKAAKKIELKTDIDKAAYAVGVSAARTIRTQFETQGVTINNETLMRGFRDGLGDGKLAISEEDMGAAIQAVEEEVAKRNAAEGDAFLAANKKKKDVVTLPSGLQYKILKKGAGKSPTLRDIVSVHFRGRMLNGKEFDNTYTGKVPLTMPLIDTIAGWKEALPLMPVGSKWELYVPTDMAFGGTGNTRIPANATLVFEVELLDVTKPEAAPGRTKTPPLEDIK